MKRFYVSVFMLIFVVGMGVSLTPEASAQGSMKTRMKGGEYELREELARIRAFTGASHPEIKKHIEKTAEWLEAGSKADKNGDREVANKYYKRVWISLEMLGIAATTGNLRQGIEEQQGVATELPQRLKNLEKEIQEMEAEKAQLEEEIAKLAKRS